MNEKTERILIVDDDQSIVFLMEKALERSGYEVAGALDGVEGLNALRNMPPFAVMLVDLMMPNMSGEELISRAREMDPYLEIIVITAVGSIESAITTLRDGRAYDYLQKPLDSMKQLSVIVDRAVAHRRLVLERAELQQKMETEAKRLQALVKNIGEAIISASAEGTITVANLAATNLLKREDLVGKQAQSVLPPKLVTVIENWQAIGGKYAASLEIDWTDKSTQLVSLTPLSNDKDLPQGWVMALRDITVLKKQDELRNQTLSEAVNKIRKPLAEAMNAVVDLNLHAPKDQQLSDGLFRLTKIWEEIQAWCDEMLSVVQSDSKRSVHPTLVNTGHLLKSIREDEAARLFQQSGGRLSVHTTPDLPAVRTDKEMVKRLLQGLLKRATMRSPQNSEVVIYAREHKGQVWIKISDDGPPVSTIDLLQFLEKSPLDLGTGSLKDGLELIRAKTILDRLDGQLWVGGSGPRGSAVTVCLPAVLPSPGAKNEAGTP